MKWDAELYDSKHEFVSQYGRALVMEVNRNAGQRNFGPRFLEPASFQGIWQKTERPLSAWTLPNR